MYKYCKSIILRVHGMDDPLRHSFQQNRTENKKRVTFAHIQ